MKPLTFPTNKYETFDYVDIISRRYSKFCKRERKLSRKYSTKKALVSNIFTKKFYKTLKNKMVPVL